MREELGELLEKAINEKHDKMQKSMKKEQNEIGDEYGVESLAEEQSEEDEDSTGGGNILHTLPGCFYDREKLKQVAMMQCWMTDMP